MGMEEHFQELKQQQQRQQLVEDAWEHWKWKDGKKESSCVWYGMKKRGTDKRRRTKQSEARLNTKRMTSRM